MKIIVDEMPKNSHECSFSRYFNDLYTRHIDGCLLSKEPFFECKMGNEGFECPHLMKFKAHAFKHHYQGDSVVGATDIPVYLGEK